MKKGFIILELLIAFAISSVVMGGLFTIINQTNQAVEVMDRIASIDIRTLLLQSQLERDLSGAFIPQERQEKSVRHADKSAAQDDRGGKKDKKNKKEYEDIALKNAFLSKNKGQNLELLTFITTNPLPAYDTLKPRLVRVAYKIVPDSQQGLAESNPAFALLRQEHENLDLVAFEKKKPRAYKVIKNIKRFSVDYLVAVEKQQEKEKKEEKTQEPKVEYKKFKQWTQEEIRQTKKQKPDVCKFSIELWDDLRKTFKSFEFDVYMVLGEQKEKPKKEKPEPKKPEKKKEDQEAKGEKKK